MTYIFEPAPQATVPVRGSDAAFPVRRIYCVGQNYAAHAREMGFEPQREAPIFFTKSAAAVCVAPANIPYPSGTQDCHHEIELVVAIGRPAFRIEPERAMDAVIAYGLGIDLTRRDLQGAARSKGHPWDTGKDFDNAAILAPLIRAEHFGQPDARHLSLTVNGEVRQDAPLSDMIWSVPELIAALSRLYHLEPGDLIFTGTPAGVGPVRPGDNLVGRLDGLDNLALTIADPE